MKKNLLNDAWSALGMNGAAELRRAGDASRNARDWPAAEDFYAKYLARRPRDFAIHVQHGHALKELGNYDGALAAYDRAIAINPQDFDVHLCKGHLLKTMGRLGAAFFSYERSVALKPDSNDAAYELLDMTERLTGESMASTLALSARNGRGNVGSYHESASDVSRLMGLNRCLLSTMDVVLSELDRVGGASRCREAFSQAIVDCLIQDERVRNKLRDLKISRDVPKDIREVYAQLKAATHLGEKGAVDARRY